MGHLSASKHQMIGGLVRALPERALRSLDMALGLTRDEPLREVARMVSDEIGRRSVREAVFLPFMPLFSTRADGLDSDILPGWLIGNAWEAMERAQPDLCRQAQVSLRGLRASDPTPPPFFLLVIEVARLCVEEPDAILMGRTSAADIKAVADFAGYLRLHRVVRRFVHHIMDFTGRLDPERATTLRLMFKDASAADENGGRRFMELLFAHLEDTSDMVRILTAVSDRPKERFLAESELGFIGERILTVIDAHLAELKRLFGRRGQPCEDLDGASREMIFILTQVQAFEHNIELGREGPWGKRIAAAHRQIAEMVEAQLKAAEGVVHKLLPMRSEKVYGTMRRDVPDMTKAPDAAQVAYALSMVRFIASTRNIASVGGFAAQHARLTQTLEAELDTYFEELLGIANGDEAFDTEAVLPWFEVTADMMEALCGEPKGHIARRRIASSGVYTPPRPPSDAVSRAS